MSVCSGRGGRARIIVAKSGSMAPRTKEGSPLRRTASTVCPKKLMRRESLEQPGDRLTDLPGRRAAPEVARPRLAVLHQPLDGRDHLARRVGVAEVLQHHRTRPDLVDGIAAPLAGEDWSLLLAELAG